MRDGAAPLAAAHGATVVEVDVDADPDARGALYGERVPVLHRSAPPGELCTTGSRHCALRSLSRASSRAADVALRRVDRLKFNVFREPRGTAAVPFAVPLS